MQTLQEMQRKIESTQDLQSVVTTMKSLAAVSIRQYEQAANALKTYNVTVEMGLQGLFRSRLRFNLSTRQAPTHRIGAVIFGSDQGMCGSLNEQVVSHALRRMAEFESDTKGHRLVVVGTRVVPLLDGTEYQLDGSFNVPGSVAAITSVVQELLTSIERWTTERLVDQVHVFHSEQLSGGSYRPREVHLLPIDQHWLSRLSERDWPTNALPMFTMDADTLFSALVREYLFVSLFRALAESLASENASRLAAMQGAERNIEDRLSELYAAFHQRRQMSITEELLDIVAGFEALEASEAGS
jgi:F-type H+-transporting ATPase subunit gamma